MKAFCVHGHFYQPPREDPLTGVIPVEPGAAPYENWNERIHAECYRPNAELGNFEKISFNIGPTLLTWMAAYDPVTYSQILDQDRRNILRWGVGNAMAQSYNHTILPLAPRRAKETQVLWGIEDFMHRFGRRPKGMWLPETAVDTETLVVLAEAGIEYTILAPWQADKTDLDTSQPYRVPLPGGRTIAIFFYNQDLSTRISFDPGSTTNADLFLSEVLVPKFHPEITLDGKPQMVLVATDGELYGHHQPFRDKFLAYLMDGALGEMNLVGSFPELWLRDFPPTRTIAIREPTSWSCHHGVLRWSGECGCTPRGTWKAPMRQAMSRISLILDEYYEKELANLVAEPWELHSQYIHVMLGQQSVEDLVQSQAGRKLNQEELWRTQLLLAAQYQRARMFTSCGWFFDDFDRIEPKNNIAYTAQAVWLTGLACRTDLSVQAMSLLKKVKSLRTGLRADQVFAYYYSRAQANLSGS